MNRTSIKNKLILSFLGLLLIVMVVVGVAQQIEVRPAPVPLLPACHVGIIYYRGDLFDVIDMGRLLGKESSLTN